jgi:hypothetical protein
MTEPSLRDDDPVGEANTEFWRSALRDSAPLELPTDNPRAASPGAATAEHRFIVTAELLAELRRRAASTGTTLHTLLLGAYHVLLGT